MARTKSQRADEDALDPVEAADVEHADDPDAGLLELDPEAELDDAVDDDAVDDEVDEDALDEDDDSDDEDGDADPTALDSGDVDPDGDEDDPVAAVVLPDAAFDDDDQVVAAVVDLDDDDDDEIEGVRDGEFVCRRCYMAMRETQLADAERLLCRDCA